MLSELTVVVHLIIANEAIEQLASMHILTYNLLLVTAKSNILWMQQHAVGSAIIRTPPDCVRLLAKTCRHNGQRHSLLSEADLDAFGAKPLLSLISKQHIAKFGVGVLTAFVPVFQKALRV